MSIIPIESIGEVGRGHDLANTLATAVGEVGAVEGDVLVVTHKVVSKSEGAVVDLSDDPEEHLRLVESEAKSIIRRRGSLTITETRHGFICANAGVDRSNAQPGTAILLPYDPDRSARRLRDRVYHHLGLELPVIISDTFGRPWRRGLTDVAIGVAGIRPLMDLRGESDHMGRTLDVTEIAVVDEIAAAADLVMGKSSMVPAALVRGAPYHQGAGEATELIRPPNEDLFR
ncbi:MAG: coenzyme F420-0:L-glutamate ligase [Acidimicrobiia bacterium]|nr:coenzyme F420-0:L-glutamate ligase [Acidimicrobiia bacterium]